MSIKTIKKRLRKNLWQAPITIESLRQSRHEAYLRYQAYIQSLVSPMRQASLDLMEQIHNEIAPTIADHEARTNPEFRGYHVFE